MLSTLHRFRRNSLCSVSRYRSILTHEVLSDFAKFHRRSISWHLPSNTILLRSTISRIGIVAQDYRRSSNLTEFDEVEEKAFDSLPDSSSVIFEKDAVVDRVQRMTESIIQILLSDHSQVRSKWLENLNRFEVKAMQERDRSQIPVEKELENAENDRGINSVNDRELTSWNEAEERKQTTVPFGDSALLHDVIQEENRSKWPLKSLGNKGASERLHYFNQLSEGIAMLLSMTSEQWIIQTEKRIIEDLQRDDDFHFQLESLISQVLKGNLSLNADEFNAILLYLSLTSHYSNEDILKTIMDILFQMSADLTTINESTFAILIPALLHRLNAPTIASRFILDSKFKDFFLQSPFLMPQAMLCLKQCQSCEKAEIFFRSILEGTKDSFALPVQAVKPLLSMYKENDKMHEAMDLIEDYLRETNFKSGFIPLLEFALKWPSRKNNGEPSDLLTIYMFIFSKMRSYEESHDASISYRMWNQLISTLVRTFRLNQKSNSTSFLHGVIWHFLKRKPGNYLGTSTIDCALIIASLHNDPELSIELLRHMLDAQAKASPPNRNRNGRLSIPPQVFQAALKTSIVGKSSVSVAALLSMLNNSNLDFPPPLVSDYMNQIISGFVFMKEFEEAKAALQTMTEQRLVPSDEAIASVIRGLAMSEQPETALTFLQDIQEGGFGKVVLGNACNDAKHFVYIQMKDWNQIIRVFQEETKALNFKPTPFVFQSVIVASDRVGDKAAAISFAESAIKSGGILNLECFHQLLKCLLPELARESIPEMRLHLRNLYECTSDKSVAEHYLDLSRSLRTAELEDDRASKQMIRHFEKDNRIQAWANVHKSLLQLYASM